MSASQFKLTPSVFGLTTGLFVAVVTLIGISAAELLAQDSQVKPAPLQLPRSFVPDMSLINDTPFHFGPRSVIPETQIPADAYVVGVVLRELPAGMHGLLGIEEGTGLMIHNVMTGSPAEQAGLEKYDLLLEINGKSARTQEQLQKTIAESKGAKVSLKIRHMTTEKTVELTPVLVKSLVNESEMPLVHRDFMWVGPGIVTDPGQFQSMQQELEQLRDQMQTLREEFEALRKSLPE